jgi:hypothetical protein
VLVDEYYRHQLTDHGWKPMHHHIDEHLAVSTWRGLLLIMPAGNEGEMQVVVSSLPLDAEKSDNVFSDDATTITLCIKYIILTVFLTIMGLTTGTTAALQSPTSVAPPSVVPTPIYTGERVLYNETSWSTDGRSLVFTGINNGMTYYRYSLDHDALTVFNQSPRIRLLSSDQQQKLQAVSDVAHVSYDGRYAFYTHQDEICGSEAGCENRIAMADLQTNEHVLIEDGLASRRWFIWSDNSESAMIISQGHYGGVSGLSHVTHYVPELDELETTLLMNFHAGSQIYVAISANGERILLREQFDGYDTGLYVWDATAPHKPQQFAASDSPLILADETVTGAAFMPDNEDEIISVTDAGIVIINISDRDEEVFWF